MTNVMLATYPDVFKAGAPMGSAPYKCAATFTEWANCNAGLVTKTPTQWGDLVRAAYPGYAGARPTVFTVQGDADTTVVPSVMTEVMEQWTNVHGVDQTSDANTLLKSYPRSEYRDSGGIPRTITWLITGMQHTWAVDPTGAPDGCGASGTYFRDVHACGAFYVAQFFGINSTTAPTSATFSGEDTNDGYVRALSNGSLPSIGPNTDNGIGHEGAGVYDRTVLSFDTSPLPDAASITRAYIRLVWSSGSGDPWSDPAGNTLQIDVKNGCFGACTIETSDWLAAPTATGAATFPKFDIPTGVSANFSSTGRSAIAKTGRTQLKLRFASFQSFAQFNFLKPGAQAKLVVEY
jgi:hypothetical protein